MDKELVDFQFFGLWGIYKESFKVLSAYKKIFTQFTISMIFPLVLIFLFEVPIAQIVFRDIFFNRRYPNEVVLQLDLFVFWLFRSAYLLFLIVISLFPTSAVVYTVASVYSVKPMTYSKVMAVVPRIWKRLLITFFWYFLVLVGYHVGAVIAYIIWALLIVHIPVFNLVAIIILFILYFVGIIYINVIWLLASVMSVLEDSYGKESMEKSKTLIKGRMFAASFIFVVMEVFLIGIKYMFEIFVVDASFLAVYYRGLIALGCFLLTVVVILYGFVTQTVIYFVCKACHQENIDKTLLSIHLEGYNYVRLGGKMDVQLEKINDV